MELSNPKPPHPNKGHSEKIYYSFPKNIFPTLGDDC